MNKEDKNKRKNTVINQALVSRLRKFGKILLSVVSTSVFSLIIIMAFVAVSGWLVYMNAWLPLQDEANLPLGVTPRNPQINENMLRELHLGRTIRTQHEPRSFAREREYFITDEIE